MVVGLLTQTGAVYPLTVTTSLGGRSNSSTSASIKQVVAAIGTVPVPPPPRTHNNTAP